MKYIWYFIKILIQCTWGFIQTAAGFAFFAANIRNPHFFYRGNIATKWNSLSGLSLGMFIFTADESNAELQKFAGGTEQSLKDYAGRITVHEYGHTIQSLILGPLMLIPGAISIMWGSLKKCRELREKYGVPYTFCWVESWASRLGEKYTGSPAIWK